MDHAAARGLDPAGAAARAALAGIRHARAVADEAVERDLRRWLGEREVVGAEADLPVTAEELPGEAVQDALEVGEAELLVDGEALVLEEDALVERVGRLEPVAAPGHDDPDRRLALFHDPDLHR